jgi:polyisoprenoid-binding protein YceI
MRITSRRSARTIATVTAVILAFPLAAWRPVAEHLALQPESRMWVEGTSTIRSFTCRAPDVSASVEGVTDAVAQVATGLKGVRTVRVTVPADHMECGNGTMNDHLKKALKVEQFPTIVFALTEYDVARTTTGVAGTLNGTLTLGGVQHPIVLQALGKREGDVLRVTGSYDLKMTDYDLTPPSLMFGRIKVGETVTVKFDLLLKS